jgi:hypothetical protein
MPFYSSPGCLGHAVNTLAFCMTRASEPKRIVMGSYPRVCETVVAVR